MEFNSIIWLSTSVRTKIHSKVIENLSLNEVYEGLLSNDEILFTLCKDIETITYRQEILTDFFEHKELIDDLMECLNRFSHLKPMYHKGLYEVSNLYRIIDIIILMEKAIVALEQLDQTLRAYPLKSKGLNDLKNKVADNLLDKEYKKMKADLKEIKYVFKKIKSATLTVSMSSGLRPVFAQVTSIDEHKFRFPKAFRRVSDVLKQDPVFLDKRLVSYVPVFKVGRINYDLLEEIEFALKEHKGMLKSFVGKYDQLDIQPFINLFNEMLFYKASFELLSKVNSQKLPLSVPRVIDSKDFSLKIHQGYNINLALKNLPAGEIIFNDFVIDQHHKCYLITGANRGGKTTFTQCIGQIQLLSQLGLYVPASDVEVSLVDGIFTHFPVSEKDTMDKGKFGKECEMFVEGYKSATQKTLFLLNESFAGTSHLESLSIANQGVKALMHRNIPFIFNTHLHELYEEVKSEGLISLTTKMNQGTSSYQLIEQEPYGKSFAREIAMKYGVTYEQLVGEGGGANETGD